MAPSSLYGLGIALVLFSRLGTSISLNLSSPDSIRSVAGTIAYDMMSIYTGNQSGQTPGILPKPPYYWWEGGAMWNALLDYWHYTNDSTYNDIIEQGMLFQTGENWDFMPSNQTNGMGNDDQGVWGMTAMTAAELNFQNPSSSNPQWLALAQAVFNQLASRWDTTACGGGLRWQVYFWNYAWPYKSAVSNGCLFNLGARLARYTGNDTYAKWADKTWDWITTVNVIQYQKYTKSVGHFNGTGAGGYVVWDGTGTDANCSIPNDVLYSYNAGIWLLGAATMYNYTNGSTTWANRTALLLNATINMYFPSSIATEIWCEYNLTSCDTDQLTFKSFLARGLAATTQLAPFTSAAIMPLLASSAAAAAKQCSGCANGRMCGVSWINGSRWDGAQGAGQQMAALEVVLANLVAGAKAPVTNGTGGTSGGDPAAGVSRGRPAAGVEVVVVGVGDRAGAGVVTVLLIVGLVGGLLWTSSDLGEDGAVEKPVWDNVLGFLVARFVMG